MRKVSRAGFRKHQFRSFILVVIVVAMMIVGSVGPVRAASNVSNGARTGLFDNSPSGNATFGDTNIGEGDSADQVNLIVGTRFTVSAPGVIQSISVYIEYSARGNAAFAVYNDESGKPSSLLGQTVQGAIGPSGAWMTLSMSGNGVAFTSGAYWLAYWFSAPVTLRYARSHLTTTLRMPYTGTFPTNFGPASAGSYEGRSIYATYSTFPIMNDFTIEQTAPASLAVGSYWSGDGFVHRALNGTGNYAGNWTMDMQYTRKFTVTRRETSVIMMTVEQSATWTRKATETWSKLDNGNSSQGSTGPLVVYYTINLATLKVVDVSSNQAQSLGHLTYFFIDPPSVRQGGNVSSDWYGSTVPFHVGASRNVSISGGSVAAWPIMYSRDWYGYWRVGDKYSTGSETRTNLYDKTYYVIVGWDIVGNYAYVGRSWEGSWTETYFDYFRVRDSNFLTPPSKINPVSFLSQPTFLIPISVIVIVIAVFAVRNRFFTKVISRLRRRRLTPAPEGGEENDET